MSQFSPPSAGRATRSGHGVRPSAVSFDRVSLTGASITFALTGTIAVVFAWAAASTPSYATVRDDPSPTTTRTRDVAARA